MASSSSPPSSLPLNWIHHVFPSFHGADVRKAFLSHILKEFRSRGIDPFIDNNIERSKSIGPELIDAIRGSRIAMVLFSKNYASSTWCLDELVEIIRCREVLGQIVMVLFYEVDPTDVKKQTGHFGGVFRKTCKGKTEHNIRRWKQALAKVAKIAGYHSKNWDDEAEMTEKIATDISNKLNNSTPSSDFDGLVGMAFHMINMEPLLQLDLEDVKTIGIVGPPGIGKTTIARFIFNQHSKDFQLSVFVENIKARYPIPACSDNYSVKLNLQKQFMSQLLNQMDITITHLGIAKDRLKCKKVLVILDDVDRLVQLEAMANEIGWFGPRSRIIITTQDITMLKKTDHIYRVDLPSSDEALQIFCMYAFGHNSPNDGFTELAWQVTRLAGELPLGLRIMGSYLRGMSKLEWSMALPKLKTRLNGEIGSILKLSYDALHDEDKELFLHITCFFNNEVVTIVKDCLGEIFQDLVYGLDILAEKSLISEDFGMIQMHNLLVQLGKEIVRKQSVKEPGKRQFLNDARDIRKVLSDDKAGGSSIVGIDLIFLNENEDITCTSENAFERLSSLQFLRIQCDGTNLRNLNFVSQELRFLSWDHFPVTCFPSRFHPKFLVFIKLQYSKLEKLWKETQPLSNLKWMDLSFSESLEELPDLSSATNLCELNLAYCSSLVKFPSIGNALHLQRLNFEHCSSLVELHSSIGKAYHLEYLDLRYCSSLKELPSSIGNAFRPKYLDLKYCSSLTELPSSIINTHRLKHLDLKHCSSLTVLPSSIGEAFRLKYLDLKHCSNLKELPSFIGYTCALEHMDLRYCSSLTTLPSSIGNAVYLQHLRLNYCSSLRELPSSMSKLGSLWRLDLKKCSKLKIVLTDFNLESLEILDLSGCSLFKNYSEMSYTTIEVPIFKMTYYGMRELGPWIGRISSLRRLVLSGMQDLVSLPQLPYSVTDLDADNCQSLERLDCFFRNPGICLNFAKCFKLNQEARDLLLHTSTYRITVLPGREVPVFFPYRASGSSLTVKLNPEALHTSTKFRACVILAEKNEYDSRVGEVSFVRCTITPNQSRLTDYDINMVQGPVFPEHLYIFEVGEMEVLSTELVFYFKMDNRNFLNLQTWEVKECGIVQLYKSFGDGQTHTIPQVGQPSIERKTVRRRKRIGQITGAFP